MNGRCAATTTARGRGGGGEQEEVKATRRRASISDQVVLLSDAGISWNNGNCKSKRSTAAQLQNRKGECSTTARVYWGKGCKSSQRMAGRYAAKF